MSVHGGLPYAISHDPFRMKAYPRSIRGRLLLAGGVFTAIALIVASLTIGEFLDRFVRRGVDERLDAQIALLVRAVRPDGSIDRAMLQEIGPYTQHRRGWGWRLDGPGGSVASRDIVDLSRLRLDKRRDRRPAGIAGRPQSGKTDQLYVRSTRKRTTGGDVRITVTAPRQMLDRLRTMALVPILLTMAGLSVVLMATTLLQLRIGLKPLVDLKRSLVAVRAGEIERVPRDQPTELVPLAEELNGLLDANTKALERARGHVANLAHGLKTPLAALSLRLNEPGRDPDGTLAELIAQIDGAIRHHLGRARAASPGAPGLLALPLASAVEDLLAVLSQIHVERGIASQADPSQELTVNCDPQDLDEMLGNLLDNAWKWAATRILVSGANEGMAVRIDIDDDGPGLTHAAAAEALVPGRRLDERSEGHGFGLSIARELAELHGGSLALGPSPLGGLRASLRLPR